MPRRLIFDSCNEQRYLSERYLKFNLPKLLESAVESVQDRGALQCVEIWKCREGLNNKAYLLQMENGVELIAKLPNPCAGPAFYTTTSDVATRAFLRDALEIPTPRILAWSADPRNLVGAEFILEEKAAGMPLGRSWQDWKVCPMEQRYKIIEEIVEMERKLASITLTTIGCIYFRDDMPDGMAMVAKPEMPASILERFSIGPLVESGMWCGKETGKEVDMRPGPFTSEDQYIRAMAENESQYVRRHSKPRMNYARSLTVPEFPEEMQHLLDQYLHLVPTMRTPISAHNIRSATLWHPDVHLTNVFVDVEAKKITSIIDWQSAAALPLSLECGIPAMFKHKISREPEEQMKRDYARSESLQEYYLQTTRSRNPRHWAAIEAYDEVRKQPARIVPSSWEDRNTFLIRRTLLRIIEMWGDLCPDEGPCPVSFSDQEMAAYLKEEENFNRIADVLTLFRDNWGLPPHGSIEASRFDDIVTELGEMRAAFIAAADNDEDRFLAEKLWPFQDSDEE